MLLAAIHEAAKAAVRTMEPTQPTMPPLASSPRAAPPKGDMEDDTLHIGRPADGATASVAMEDSDDIVDAGGRCGGRGVIEQGAEVCFASGQSSRRLEDVASSAPLQEWPALKQLVDSEAAAPNAGSHRQRSAEAKVAARAASAMEVTTAAALCLQQSGTSLVAPLPLPQVLRGTPWVFGGQWTQCVQPQRAGAGAWVPWKRNQRLWAALGQWASPVCAFCG